MSSQINFSTDFATEVEDDGYFDQDFKLQAIWLGLLWFFLGTFPIIMFEIIKVVKAGSTFGTMISWSYFSGGEWHAWYVMRYGIGPVFWVLGIWWLLAYIKTDEHLV